MIPSDADPETSVLTPGHCKSLRSSASTSQSSSAARIRKTHDDAGTRARRWLEEHAGEEEDGLWGALFGAPRTS